MSERSCQNCNKGHQIHNEDPLSLRYTCTPLSRCRVGQEDLRAVAAICKYYEEREEKCGEMTVFGGDRYFCSLPSGHKDTHVHLCNGPGKGLIWPNENNPPPTPFEEAWEEYCKKYDPLYIKLPGETEATSRQIQKERFFAGWQACIAARAEAWKERGIEAVLCPKCQAVEEVLNKIHASTYVKDVEVYIEQLREIFRNL